MRFQVRLQHVQLSQDEDSYLVRSAAARALGTIADPTLALRLLTDASLGSLIELHGINELDGIDAALRLACAVSAAGDVALQAFLDNEAARDFATCMARELPSRLHSLALKTEVVHALTRMCATSERLRERLATARVSNEEPRVCLIAWLAREVQRNADRRRHAPLVLAAVRLLSVLLSVQRHFEHPPVTMPLKQICEALTRKLLLVIQRAPACAWGHYCATEATQLETALTGCLVRRPMVLAVTHTCLF